MTYKNFFFSINDFSAVRKYAANCKKYGIRFAIIYYTINNKAAIVGFVFNYKPKTLNISFSGKSAFVDLYVKGSIKRRGFIYLDGTIVKHFKYKDKLYGSTGKIAKEYNLSLEQIKNLELSKEITFIMYGDK